MIYLTIFTSVGNDKEYRSFIKKHHPPPEKNLIAKKPKM